MCMLHEFPVQTSHCVRTKYSRSDGLDKVLSWLFKAEDVLDGSSSSPSFYEFVTCKSTAGNGASRLPKALQP